MSSRNKSPSGLRLEKDPSLKKSNEIKSSGFYPTTMCKDARKAIVEHMNSHYKRLQKVKAVVDTKPPKSYSLSRSSSPSRSINGSSRPNSRSSIRSNESQYTQVNRNEIIQSTNKINYYLEAMRKEQQRLFNQLAKPNFRRPKNCSSVSAKSITPCRLKHLDLIEKHSENFTNPERPFVPRVLKSNAKSKLRENRWYNPPRRKDNQRANSKDESSVYDQDWESDLDIQSLSNSVRDVNGSVNGDHEHENSLKNWLENHVYESDTREISRPSTCSNKLRKQSLEISSKTSSRQVVNIKDKESLRKTPGEESLPYLQFIVDVTNDILVRGIYTNKVLKQVFTSHLERRKSELKMDKMETALKQLQIDLGISDDDNDVTIESFGYGYQPSIDNGYSQKLLARSTKTNSFYGFDSFDDANLSLTQDRSVISKHKSIHNESSVESIGTNGTILSENSASSKYVSPIKKLNETTMIEEDKRNVSLNKSNLKLQDLSPESDNNSVSSDECSSAIEDKIGSNQYDVKSAEREYDDFF